MSATLLLALLLQFATVVLLRHRLGKTWLRRPVTLLVLASVVYDGLSQILLAFPSISRWDTYRQGVAQQYVDQAALTMSAGLLALTVAYLLTRPERAVSEPAAGDPGHAARVLDWRLLALACVPLAVLTYEGRGYNDAVSMSAATPLSSDLAGGFFVIAVVLAAFAFLLRHGTRWFLPVLLAQSILLAAAGERSPVLADAIVLAVLLSCSGCRPSARQVTAATVLTAVTILAVTGVRAEQGRGAYRQDTGLGSRVSALASGITGLGGTSPQGSPGLLAQAAVRLDGTSFAAGILQAEHLGQPRLPAGGVPESLLIAVPSAAWPSKLARGDALNPVKAETADFGLQPVNFLPGLAGMYAGFLSPAWLIAFLALLGAVGGWAERWLLRSWTPARLVLLAGAVTAALRFEQGLPGMLVTLRAAVVIAVAVRLAGAVLARRAEAPSAPTLRADI